jgi:hypothetical protein
LIRFEEIRRFSLPPIATDYAIDFISLRHYAEFLHADIFFHCHFFAATPLCFFIGRQSFPFFLEIRHATLLMPLFRHYAITFRRYACHIFTPASVFSPITLSFSFHFHFH